MKDKNMIKTLEKAMNNYCSTLHSEKVKRGIYLKRKSLEELHKIGDN